MPERHAGGHPRGTGREVRPQLRARQLLRWEEMAEKHPARSQDPADRFRRPAPLHPGNGPEKQRQLLQLAALRLHPQRGRHPHRHHADEEILLGEVHAGRGRHLDHQDRQAFPEQEEPPSLGHGAVLQGYGINYGLLSNYLILTC